MPLMIEAVFDMNGPVPRVTKTEITRRTNDECLQITETSPASRYFKFYTVDDPTRDDNLDELQRFLDDADSLGCTESAQHALQQFAPGALRNFVRAYPDSAPQWMRS